jgi:hypothetical protein
LPRLQNEAANEEEKLRQQIEGNDLDTQEGELKLKRAELEAQIQVQVLGGAAIKRVLEIYEQQLAAAER